MMALYESGQNVPNTYKRLRSQVRAREAAVERWPTPTVTGNYNRKGASKDSGDMWPAPEAGMPVATPHSQMLRETWPTPRKCAAMNASMTTTLAQRNHGNLEEAVAARMIPDGGKLNPPWVEWLMGWPLGWTDLRASAMDRFQQWRRSHGSV